MTRAELHRLVEIGKLYLHHTAYVRCYVRRTGSTPEPKEYTGKFGKGYTLLSPNRRSSRYSYISYYVTKE